MGIINVLDFQVANLIAAGEVVERPASAVKELLENAMDAGATEITVEIKRGGISFIRISDNGCGMSREDLPVAIRRHATSKIRTEKDLDGITTLGFRGEALAAIASVSRLRIMTKRKEDATGTLLTCEGGQVTDLTEAGCKTGTTVIVEELFANVPARRKFLKKDSSEAMAVTSIVEKIALSRPDISFKLIVEGALKFQTRGDGKIASVIYAVIGREFASKLLEVRSLTDGVEVRGYIGTPMNVRSNRNFQNFFINNRYIKSKTATAALEQAFESYLETQKFPCCVLHIYIHPTFVDVNVHPTKMEVKFSNERLVFDAIYCAVRNTLEEATSRPEIKFEPHHMTPEQHSIYNAFVPVYDRIADTEAKGLTQQQLFDEMRKPESQAPNADGPQSNGTESNGPQSGERAAVSSAVWSANSSGHAFQDTDPSFRSIFDEPSPPLTVPEDRPAYQNGEQIACSLPVKRKTFLKDEAIFTGPDWFELLPPALPENQSNPSVSESPTSQPPASSSLSKSSSEAPFNEAAPSLFELPDNAVSETAPDSPQNQFLFSLSSDFLASAPHAASASNGEYRLLGVAFHTYIFVEWGEKIVIIDKHAAHERILFEKMKKIMEEQSGTAQMLILPLEITLGKEEADALIEYGDEIRRLGFEYTADREKGRLICTQIPSILTSDRANDMLIAIAGALIDGTGSVKSARRTFFEEALYQASCKAAVKAGQINRDEDMGWIVAQLFENPDILYCPHGRPVALILSKGEVEHRFKRS